MENQIHPRYGGLWFATWDPHKWVSDFGRISSHHETSYGKLHTSLATRAEHSRDSDFPFNASRHEGLGLATRKFHCFVECLPRDVRICLAMRAVRTVTTFRSNSCILSLKSHVLWICICLDQFGRKDRKLFSPRFFFHIYISLVFSFKSIHDYTRNSSDSRSRARMRIR